MKNAIGLLLVALILSVNTSCLKKQNLSDDNLGPAVAAAEISASISDVIGNDLIFDAKKDEFSSYILSQRIQDMYADTVEQQDMTVESVQVTADRLVMNSQVTKINYSGGQTTQQSKVWPWIWDLKPTTPGEPTTAPLADNEAPTYLFMRLWVVQKLFCVNAGDSPQACYKLQVSDINFQVPPTSADQHNCPNAYQCFIKARKIEFDQLLLAEPDLKGKPKRNHIKMIISKEVPFLSRLLQYCQRGLYETNNQQILLDYCYNSNGYKFGTN